MKRGILEALLLVMLACGAAGVTYRWHPERPELYLSQEKVAEDEVSLATARTWEKEKGGVVWIDARTRREYDKDHAPGAILLNMTEFDDLMFQHIETLNGNSFPKVIYCDSQKCDQSRALAEKLESLGMTDIWILRGGWQAFSAAPTP